MVHIFYVNDNKRLTANKTDEMFKSYHVCHSVFRGHSDAVNAIAFTHDSRYLVTACNEGTWRLFRTVHNQDCEALMICDEAHDLGVQGCDFSPTINFIVDGN